MIYEDPLVELLSVHNFKLKKATAEMLCYAFNKRISCERKINKQLFNRFEKYKPLYVFSYGGVINYPPEKQPIKLYGVEIIVPPGKEEEFIDKNSNFIYYGSSESKMEWLDIDENNNFTGVYGTCRITF